MTPESDQTKEREKRRRASGCSAMGEVMTPDACLRDIACGKKRKGHGRWHENRQVRWPGRWKAPVYADEVTDRLFRPMEERIP